jgi:hypothetical protein
MREVILQAQFRRDLLMQHELFAAVCGQHIHQMRKLPSFAIAPSILWPARGFSAGYGQPRATWRQLRNAPVERFQDIDCA